MFWSVSFFMQPAGIEPTLQESESCVLSVRLRLLLNMQRQIIRRCKRSFEWDSNPRPTHYECVALPTEPSKQARFIIKNHSEKCKCFLRVFLLFLIFLYFSFGINRRGGILCFCSFSKTCAGMVEFLTHFGYNVRKRQRKMDKETDVRACRRRC